MTQDSSVPPTGRRARRVGTSVTARRAKGRRKAFQPRKVVVRVILAALLSLALVTGLGVNLAYNHWNNLLVRKDLNGQLHNRPAKLKAGPLNIMVMGSDSRSGKGDNIDGKGDIGERSDTTILFHLSADRKFAYGISIPRDTLVDRPTCYKADGTEIPAADNVMWNDAFSVGGPACTIQQFEQLSGVRVDNYIVVDFNGFKNMVDALDGVEVCIPQEIDDPDHHIKLMPGTREVKGQEALSYVRVRYTVGDGTDTMRIHRQQAFMASMIKKAVSAGMVARPDRVVKFINALTGSLTTDFKNVAQMASIAEAAKGVGLNDIKFVTTPWHYSTTDVGRVEWDPAVHRLFHQVAEDLPLGKQFLEQSISAAENPNGTASTSPSTGTTGKGGKKKGGKKASAGASATASATQPADGGLSSSEREAAGLCTS